MLMREAFSGSSDNPSVYKYRQTVGLSVKTNSLLSSTSKDELSRLFVLMDNPSVCPY